MGFRSARLELQMSLAAIPLLMLEVTNLSIPRDSICHYYVLMEACINQRFNVRFSRHYNHGSATIQLNEQLLVKVIEDQQVEIIQLLRASLA